MNSWITFSLQPTASPITGNSTFFDSSMILHHGCQQIQLIIKTAENYSSPINVCNILYQLSIKPLTQMCQITIHSQDIPLFNLQNHTPTLTPHMMLTFKAGVSHTSVHSER
jgi:hypothetical protein